MKQICMMLATAVALTAAALWAAEPAGPLEPDGHTRILSHLDGGSDVIDPTMLFGGHGNLSGKTEAPAFDEGRIGRGLQLKGEAGLEFPSAGGNFPEDVGTLELFLKPLTPWTAWSTIFSRGSGTFDAHFDKEGIVWTIPGKGASLNVVGKYGDWPADQWHHLAFCWDLPHGKAAIYLDGKVIGEASSAKPVIRDASAAPLRFNARKNLDAVVDELRVSDIWRYPGSEGYQGRAVPPLATDRPLNDDSGFETCTLGTLADPQPAWNRGEGAAGATWELVADNPHSGKRCLKVLQPVLGMRKAITCMRQGWVPATAGRTYTLTAWLRTDTPGLEARLALGTENWHTRQVTLRPTTQWKAYSVSWKLPNGAQDDVGSLLFGQIENWGKGAIYIDDATISESGKDTPPESFLVDAASDQGAWPTVYAGVDDALICWQGAALDDEALQMLKDAGITRVRYSIFCTALGLISKAEGQWDWTMIDHHFARYLKYGIQPIPAFHFTPPWMSRDGTRDTPPKDFEQWGKLVSEVVRHLNVEKKYGIRYFEVWNEPDLPFWKNGTPEDFCKLYDVFVKAVKSVDSSARVGGPAISGSGCNPQMVFRGAAQFKYLHEFIEHCGQNNVPVDFLSFHRYTLDPAQMKSTCEEIRASLQKYPSLRDAELYISEWNLAAGQDARGQRLDTNQNASYAAAWIGASMDGGLDFSTFFTGKDGGTGDKASLVGRLFAHNTGLMAEDNTPKPVYNAMKAWSMLEKTRLYSEGGSPNTSLFATRGRDVVSLIIWNNAAPARRTLTIDNMPFSGKANLERCVIDGRHSNAFAKWQAMKRVEKYPAPTFAQGSFGKIVEAASVNLGDWKKEAAEYRSAAPAGASAQVATTHLAGGKPLEWSVEVPADGEYFPWIKADCSYYGGVVEVLLDGKSIGACDQFIGGLDARWFGLGGQMLKAGTHTLVLSFTDKPGVYRNPKAAEASIDLLALTDDKAFAPKPLAGGTESEAGVDLRQQGALEKVETTTLDGGRQLVLPLELSDHSVTLLRLTPAR